MASRASGCGALGKPIDMIPWGRELGRRSTSPCHDCHDGSDVEPHVVIAPEDGMAQGLSAHKLVDVKRWLVEVALAMSDVAE